VNTGYGVIVADPAWRYERSGVEGSAEREYSTMAVDEICALPVASLAARDSVLLLWGTWPLLTYLKPQDCITRSASGRPAFRG
jgi:N6-adenosine-specific RNA methylase IME4